MFSSNWTAALGRRASTTTGEPAPCTTGCTTSWPRLPTADSSVGGCAGPACPACRWTTMAT
eukprot:1564990-Prymnesium_polylepis.1